MSWIAMLGVGLAGAGGCAPKELAPLKQPIALERVPLQYDADTDASFAISPTQWQGLQDLFAGVTDGPSERAAISLAIARFEQIAGEQTPINNDGRKDYGHGVGQCDCLDESANSTVFLRVLYQEGVLKHHRPMHRTVRSFWCIDIVHWTAVVQDTDTGEYWAVDSWFNANAIPAIVQPLRDWYWKKRVPGYYAEDAPTQPIGPIRPTSDDSQVKNVE